MAKSQGELAIELTSLLESTPLVARFTALKELDRGVMVKLIEDLEFHGAEQRGCIEASAA